MTSTASRATSSRAVCTRISRRAARAAVCPLEGRQRAPASLRRHCGTASGSLLQNGALMESKSKLCMALKSCAPLEPSCRGVVCELVESLYRPNSIYRHSVE
eukprot:scaffold47696_cov72-Phaeocystis_antarctica.AAC.6